MAIDISQFYQVFFEETREHLQEIEQLLLKLDIDQPDLDQLNAIFRAAHSIKGGSATFGFNDITSVTHVLEGLLDRLRKKEIALQAQMIDVFLQATDMLNVQLNGHIDGTPAEANIANQVTNELAAFSNDINLLKTDNAAQAKAEDGFGFFDEDNKVDDGFDFFETEQKKPDVDDNFGLFEPLTPANIAPLNNAKLTDNRRMDRRAGDRRSSERSSESSSIRVDVAKVDQLINLVGELVITEAMLVQGLSNAPIAILEALNSNMAQLQRNTRDLQEVIMSVRMMPISNLFTRFPRLVRDLASKLKKDVELITIGEETELDKGLIEQIADPLTHLVRNSLDHGLESPAVRKAAGKPTKGKVILSATHQGGSIMIEVIDDGAGLNKELIIKKAKQNGLSLPSRITDDNLWDGCSQPQYYSARWADKRKFRSWQRLQNQHTVAAYTGYFRWNDRFTRRKLIRIAA
jgi:two-component system chemotaxis sensor kinase CheA